MFVREISHAGGDGLEWVSTPPEWGGAWVQKYSIAPLNILV